jgi:hypothetical protein
MVEGVPANPFGIPKIGFQLFSADGTSPGLMKTGGDQRHVPEKDVIEDEGKIADN